MCSGHKFRKHRPFGSSRCDMGMLQVNGNGNSGGIRDYLFLTMGKHKLGGSFLDGAIEIDH